MSLREKKSASSRADRWQPCASEPKKASAYCVPLAVDWRDVKIPEDVALAAVRDLGLSMGNMLLQWIVFTRFRSS
jgi:hypothetical protein